MNGQVKFRIDDPGIFWSLQTIDQLGPYSISELQFEEIDDVYLDTRKRKLLAAGYYCRQRKQTEGFLISLIALTPSEGHFRQLAKWEVSLKNNSFVLKDWPESQVRSRIGEIIFGKKLQPVFRLRQTRITRTICNDNRDIAKANLDHATISLKGQSQQFKTLKITMVVPNEVDHLETISAILQKNWKLEIEPRTKFEQILALEMKGI
jgi:inorganic triphosphatase YgiF